MTSVQGQGLTGVGPTSFKWSHKSSAARFCGACRDGREVDREGQGSVRYGQGSKWKVWGLAQGCRQIHEWEEGGVWKGGKPRRVSTNFMIIIFVLIFFLFLKLYVDFFVFGLYFAFFFLQMVWVHNLGSESWMAESTAGFVRMEMERDVMGVGGVLIATWHQLFTRYKYMARRNPNANILVEIIICYLCSVVYILGVPVVLPVVRFYPSCSQITWFRL